MEERVYYEELNLQDEIFNKISIKLIKEIKLVPFHEDKDQIYVLKIIDNFDYNSQIIKLIFNKDIIFKSISLDDYERIVNFLSKSSLQGFYENIINKNKYNTVTIYIFWTPLYVLFQ